MIHRIREIAASLQDVSDDIHSLGSPAETEEEEDPGLELLVKNAVRDNWLEHDPRKVWKELSARVRGPFGQMAVEEPAMAGQPMPLAVELPEADNRPEVMRHRFFRLSDSVMTQR
jgi:hypothetical protein